MASPENKIQSDSGQQRSPSFPLFTVDEAIERTQKIYTADKRAWATFENIATHIGYTNTKKGGRTGRAISALKQYGLVEEQKGQYRVTIDAQKIFELPETDPEREQLIRNAALKPAIVQKVLKHYQGELPSESTLRTHLIFTEGFTPDAASDFMKVVRRTVEIANPTKADYNGGDSSDETPPAGGTPRMQTPQRQQQPGGGGFTPPAKPPTAQRTYPLYLSTETEAVLYVPSVITKSEYDLLKSQIDSSLKVMLATSVIPDPQLYPQSATWKNKDHDQPVIVVGELGPGPDGERYFKIQGSNSGIPEKELHFKDAKAKGAA